MADILDVNSLVFENRSDDPVPFTLEQLFQSTCLVAFTYRQVWAQPRWDVIDTESPSQWIRSGWFQGETPITVMRSWWLKQSLGTNQKDNHQTFLVEINRKMYFVTFSDGYIWIGDTAVGE